MSKRYNHKLLHQVARKIGYQFPGSPGGKLMFAIVRQSIIDLNSKSYHNGAAHFLAGEMSPALLCGVDPEWIRLVLKRAGIKL